MPQYFIRFVCTGQYAVCDEHFNTVMIDTLYNCGAYVEGKIREFFREA